jgi:hypothetical protein
MPLIGKKNPMLTFQSRDINGLGLMLNEVAIHTYYDP